MGTVRRLAWVGLVSLLAGGCKPRKQELVCKPIAIFEVEPAQDAGTAPFSIDRFGRKVESGALMRVPTIITLSGNNQTQVDWELLHHIYSYSELIYSPAEGLARDPDEPKDVHPMRRFFDGKSERVRFGFRSKACPKRDQYGTWVYCEYGNDELSLAIDMTCQSRQIE